MIWGEVVFITGGKLINYTLNKIIPCLDNVQVRNWLTEGIGELHLPENHKNQSFLHENYYDMASCHRGHSFCISNITFRKHLFWGANELLHEPASLAKYHQVMYS